MRIGIKYKLFVVISLACALVISGMFLLMQWSFDRGLLSYVNKNEADLLSLVKTNLEQEYSSYGHWDFVSERPRHWHQFLARTLPLRTDFRLPPRTGFDPGQSGFRPQQDHRRGVFDRPPPRHDGARRQAEENDHFEKREPREQRDPLQQRDQRDSLAQNTDTTQDPTLRRQSQSRTDRRVNRGPKAFHLRLSLFDAEQRWLAGPQANFAQQQTRAIYFKQQIVGYLALQPRKELAETNELQFAAQQADTFGLIALGVLLVAAGLALPLARQLVRPIKQLKESMRLLAAGHYQLTQEHLNLSQFSEDNQSGDELSELARDFSQLAKTLAQNRQIRQQWMADIAHELRTPLAVLQAEIEALIDGVRQPNPQSIASLHQEVLQLTRLVNDLYELSLSDLGGLSYQKAECDLVAILNDCVLQIKPRLAQKNIEFELDITTDKPLMTLIDPQRIKQLLNNLLNNSYHYTDAQGLIKLELAHNKDQIQINLHDSAPGVSPQDLDKLFDRLFRVESSRNRASGGAGLGMAIAKNIVIAHQGTIEAKHSPLGGLWIAITIPLIDSR